LNTKDFFNEGPEFLSYLHAERQGHVVNRAKNFKCAVHFDQWCRPALQSTSVVPSCRWILQTWIGLNVKIVVYPV